MYQELCTEQALADTGTWTSPNVRLWDFFQHHAMEYLVTGTGSITIKAETSISGKNWINNGDKLKGAKSSSGPDGNGTDVINLRIKHGEFIRFTVTSSGDTVTTLWFSQK